ncbi:competence/damage-inducible protein A [bacterium]|nr:competence/damage-inducible protein A [bacterium]
MQAEIITIGDELLIGQTIDTNSAWMGEQLNKVGVEVHQIRSVRDRPDSIVTALDSLHPESRLVLITGGLGPTRDDKTKATLARYFNTTLEFNPDVFAHIDALFRSFGRDLSRLNRDQAVLPVGAALLKNDVGTASGMRFERNGIFYVALPGVPYEMKHLMETHVFPWIRRELQDTHIEHRTVYTQGVPESELAHRIAAFEENLPDTISLAYLPSPGKVRLRLSSQGEREVVVPQVDAQVKALTELLGEVVYSVDEEEMERVLARMLTERKARLALAESCTGGYVAHRLTRIPGSSAWFLGGVVAYSNEAKNAFLGVAPELIARHGAVSEEVAMAMASGARTRFNSDYTLSLTGIAGPDGGSEEKPVGTVWIGISGPEGTRALRHRFGTDRIRNIERSALAAFDLLRKSL